MKPSNLKILNIQSNILNIKYSNYLIFKFLKGLNCGLWIRAFKVTDQDCSKSHFE